MTAFLPLLPLPSIGCADVIAAAEADNALVVDAVTILNPAFP
jgi:hypothetical protein